MNPRIVFLLALLLYPVSVNGGEGEESKSKDVIEVYSPTNSQEPIGKPGLMATYEHESGLAIPGSVVRTLTVALGP